MEKIDWDNFKYPDKCLLSDRAKAALIDATSSGKSDPFRICRHGQLGECPIDVQRKCFNGVLDIKDARKK